jgi:ferrous iron transport protein A
VTPPITAEPVLREEPTVAATVGREALRPGTRPVPMGQLPDRARAVVHSIVAEDDFKRPLLDLGLTPGTEVLVVRRAPLWDPIEVYVRGSHFSIRREEANRILVEAV